MSRLETPAKLRLLRTMLLSRLGDLREQSLIRQGKGWFHVSGMGHEVLALAGQLLIEGDVHAGYYRDRPIALGRGFANYDLALAFFAKRASASGGRQMPAHYSNKELGVFSVASVVGGSLLPACGFAWGMQLDGKSNVVLTTVGDAGTRQGDFYEAVAFAKERQLPMCFLVEDNGIGISSVTAKITPLALGVLNNTDWEIVDGCDAEAFHASLSRAYAEIRAGGGPRFIWCRCERISSHSSADDHRKYRSEEELASLEDKDPINRLKQALIAAGALTEDGYQKLRTEVEAEVRADYERAWQELDPDPETLLDHVFGPPAKAPRLPLELGAKARMVDAINGTFFAALKSNRDYVFFGQDIADPKGGVFSLTKGLSTAHPEQVHNSPLAESTIIGVAVGLAAYGKRPVFEIQFTDFIWPGFNQLVTHLSTLHWRTQGEWCAPAVLYAPYGAYLPGGALWHSQSNEAALAHFPGVQIAVPSTPEDAAGLFWTAMHGNSPTLILIPKHLMWHPRELPASLTPLPFGKARVVRAGGDVTIVSWGNCLEVVEEALKELGDTVAAEIIDLRSIAPLDFATIEQSVAKTGRLLVVHEDAVSCSVGQNILARVSSHPELFARLHAAPVLLAKPDVPVGYNPVLEYACLPSKRDVVRTLQGLATQRRQLATSATPLSSPSLVGGSSPAVHKLVQTFAESAPGSARVQEIRVPILGEGITSAKVISLLVKPGETVEADDPLCEVETDKALFPIESPFEGVLQEWHIREGDEVGVDQLIAVLAVEESVASPTPAVAARREAAAPAVVQTELADKPTEGGLSPRIIAQLKNVVPAHMTVKAGWSGLKAARAEAKKRHGKDAPSPTVMLAWALVRAMEKHPIFTCTIGADDTLTRHREFDFGVAVSMENDALDTAVVHKANALSWPGFVEAYNAAVAKVRTGRSVSKAGTPLILTSMGGFSVRDALPVVVPPAIGTLFVGESHMDFAPDGSQAEVVSLCLSFDHRWLNGVAGAQFLSEVRTQMETFKLP